jgi:hypothetical protein
MGGAINWYLSTGFTGAHSGTPTVFLWPGEYATESNLITIPNDTSVNVQLSTGSIVQFEKGLFRLRSGSHLNITGQHLGNSLQTLPNSKSNSAFRGSNTFLDFDFATTRSTVTIDGVSIYVTGNAVPLDLTPGSTGSTNEVIINNSTIEYDNGGNLSGESAIIADGPISVSLDNSVLIAEKGGTAAGLVSLGLNGNGGRLSITDSVLWHKGTGSNAGNGIVTDIGSTTSTSLTHNITLSGVTVYSNEVKSRYLLYDNGSTSTGTLRVTTNGNTAHNMDIPAASSASNGVFLISGVGIIQAQYLNSPIW